MRRQIRGIAAAGWVLLGALGAGALALALLRPSTGEAQRPGILLITIDTLRVDRVGAYGAGSVPTPALDRLAAEGVRFTAAYAPAPLTLPAHASILSGQLPIEHTVRSNDGYRVPADVPLVSEALRAAGYRTAAVIGSAVLRAETGIGRGFETFDDRVGPAGARRAGEVIDNALGWLETVRDQSFFLWVHLFDPHLPYDPPEPFASRFRGRPYDGEVAYVDEMVGRLLARVGEPDLARRTHVIAVADHGEGLGDHGERSHGVLLYDTTVRVPLLLRPAGRRSRGEAIDRPVSAAQIAPTIRDLAGLPAAGTLPPLLASAPETEPVIVESLYTAQQLGWSPLYALRVGSLKLIDAPRPELYDLAADPQEGRDLAATRPEQGRDLRTRLHRDLQAAARRASRSSTAAADPAVGARLAALGYASGGGALAGVPEVSGIDPKARLEAWHEVERGLELEASGRRDAAVAVFASVLARDPGNVLALKFLGAHALERGELGRAIELNEKVAASGLHLPDALNNLSIAYLRAGRLDAARDRARLAVQIQPESPAARGNLALVLQALGVRDARAGQIDRAIAAFREAARADPENLDARERLAAMLHRAGEAAEAKALFESVVVEAPDRPAPHLSLAILDLESGRTREAIARLQRIRRGWAGAYRAECYLGDAFRAIDDRTQAREAYAACVANAPAGDPLAGAARRALQDLR